METTERYFFFNVLKAISVHKALNGSPGYWMVAKMNNQSLTKFYLRKVGK